MYFTWFLPANLGMPCFTVHDTLVNVGEPGMQWSNQDREAGSNEPLSFAVVRADVSPQSFVIKDPDTLGLPIPLPDPHSGLSLSNDIRGVNIKVVHVDNCTCQSKAYDSLIQRKMKIFPVDCLETVEILLIHIMTRTTVK